MLLKNPLVIEGQLVIEALLIEELVTEILSNIPLFMLALLKFAFIILASTIFALMAEILFVSQVDMVEIVELFETLVTKLLVALLFSPPEVLNDIFILILYII